MTYRERPFLTIEYGALPTTEHPVCDFEHCLTCAISRDATESREAFVARMRALYLSGRLFGPTTPLESLR